MGDRPEMSMSRVICALLLITIVAQTVEGISFQDLVDRAEAADSPKKVKTEKHEEAPVLPTLDEVAHKEDMEAWSTDHLLGLDAPPPADFMATLIPKSVKEDADKAKAVAKKAAANKAAAAIKKAAIKKAAIKKAAAHAAKVAKPEHAAKVHHLASAIVPEEDNEEVSPIGTEAESQFDLLHPGSPLHTAAHHETMLAPPNVDTLLGGSKTIGGSKTKGKGERDAAKRMHKSPESPVTKVAKKKVKKMVEADPKATQLAGSLMENLRRREKKDYSLNNANKLMHASDSDDEGARSTHMLTGFASSLIKKARQANRKQRVDAAKQKTKDDALAKQRARIEKMGNDAAGGALPELDLDMGDDEPAKLPSQKDVPSLDNFLNIDDPNHDSEDSDDDDFIQTDSWM